MALRTKKAPAPVASPAKVFSKPEEALPPRSAAGVDFSWTEWFGNVPLTAPLTLTLPPELVHRKIYTYIFCQVTGGGIIGGTPKLEFSLNNTPLGRLPLSFFPDQHSSALDKCASGSQPTISNNDYATTGGASYVAAREPDSILLHLDAHITPPIAPVAGNEASTGTVLLNPFEVVIRADKATISPFALSPAAAGGEALRIWFGILSN